MLEDLDPAETQEWIDALDPVLAFEGAERAFHLLDEVVAEARGPPQGRAGALQRHHAVPEHDPGGEGGPTPG